MKLIDQVVKDWPKTFADVNMEVKLYSGISFGLSREFEKELDENKIDNFTAIIIPWPVNNIDKRKYKGESENLITIYLFKLFNSLRKTKDEQKVIKKWKRKLEKDFPGFSANAVINEISKELSSPFNWNNFCSSPFHQKFSRTYRYFSSLNATAQNSIVQKLLPTLTEPIKIDTHPILALQNNHTPSLSYLAYIFVQYEQYELNRRAWLEALIYSNILCRAKHRHIFIFLQEQVVESNNIFHNICALCPCLS